MAEVGSIDTPFRVVIGGLVDHAKMNEKVVEELKSAARHSRGLISMASKSPVEEIECLYSPTPALSDPFLAKSTYGESSRCPICGIWTRFPRFVSGTSRNFLFAISYDTGSQRCRIPQGMGSLPARQ